MKKLALILTVSTTLSLVAQEIKLTPQQNQDWHIQSAQPIPSKTLSIGSFMGEVTTPPQLLHSISLPFEAQVKKLFVANYDNIQKGDLLAEVTGRDWIELQQRFISDAITLKHHGDIASRKNRLCKEEIIPKKECTTANATYRADKIKVVASKALLKGYGATNRMIQDLFEDLKIAQTLSIRSDVDGKIVQLNAQSGKRTSPSDALFVIQKEGALWLEVEMLAKKAMRLKNGEAVKISFNHESFDSHLLLHSPTINPQNQTQKVRFSLPKSEKFLTGMRDTAQISTLEPTLKVPKKAVIDYQNQEIVFLKTDQGYRSMRVNILGEDALFYYIEDKPTLHHPIATSSIAILKSLMEEGHE